MHTNNSSFKGYTIVSCGTLSPELNYLKDEGFLDADRILYTRPGLHEIPDELEKQIKKQIDNARKYSQKIIILYGEKCYVDTKDLSRGIDRIIRETDANAKRIEAKNCIDMLAGYRRKRKDKRRSKGLLAFSRLAGILESNF